MNIIIDQFQVEDLRIFVLKLSFDNINTLYYGWLNSLHESNVDHSLPQLSQSYYSSSESSWLIASKVKVS